MAITQWTLFDQSLNQRTEQGILGTQSGGQVEFRRLDGGLSAGVDVVTINNGTLKIDVLPTRGMSVWKAWHGDEEVGWKSPTRGPVHPAFVDLGEPSGLGWLDGFDELLVRCGLESNGAPEHDANGKLLYPLHGRIGNKPAWKVDLSIDDSTGEIALTGWVEEVRFHFLKASLKSTLRTTVGSNSFQIEDEITNLSASPTEIQMLYHINFGLPLLDGGSQLVAPVKEVVPRNEHAAADVERWNHYRPESPGFEEQVYFATLHSDKDGNSGVLLKNAQGTRGACVRFNVQQLPCFTLWKNTTAADDGYVTGLEPGTNFPNPRTFEGIQKRFLNLAGKESVTLGLAVEYCAGATIVAQAESELLKVASAEPVIHNAPRSVWCQID